MTVHPRTRAGGVYGSDLAGRALTQYLHAAYTLRSLSGGEVTHRLGFEPADIGLSALMPTEVVVAKQASIPRRIVLEFAAATVLALVVVPEGAVADFAVTEGQSSQGRSAVGPRLHAGEFHDRWGDGTISTGSPTPRALSLRRCACGRVPWLAWREGM